MKILAQSCGLLALCLLFFAPSNVAVLDKVDQSALISFFNSLTSKGTLSWDTSLDLCGQQGVLCNFNKVVQLTIAFASMNGTLPTQLGLLTDVNYIYLASNQLHGSIPTEIGALTKMTGIIINNNKLSGQLPTELGNLEKITRLTLFSNAFTGTIPSEFGNMASMKDLDLQKNSLTGTIPKELSLMTTVTKILLNSNNLTGTIPTELDLLPLNSLQLANNPLCFDRNYTSWATNTDSVAPNYCDNCENPCRNGGICNPTPGVLNCTCVGTFDGPVCQYDVQLCRYLPCQNGGTCVNGPNTFTCQCSGTGFTGSFCEQEEPFEVPCPPGFYYLDGLCLPCSAGTFRTSAQVGCVPCQKGTNSSTVAAQSPSVCSVCPAGFFAPVAGSLTCDPCDDGDDSCPRLGSFTANFSPPTMRAAAFKQVVVDSEGQAVTSEVEESLIGYYYLGAFFAFVLLSGVFAFVFRKRLRKAVANVAIILKTPMSYMQVVLPSGDVAEVSSFYRGLVGIWVVAGIILVTAYQIHNFVILRMMEISALQPGTVFTNGVSTYQTSTRLSLKVEFYNTPLTCAASDFTFAILTEHTLPANAASGVPDCEEDPDHLSVVLTYTFSRPLSFTPGSVVTIQATSVSGSPLFTQAILYELTWDSYQGRVVTMTETLAETATNKLGGDGRVGLSAIPTEYLELRTTRSQGYTYSKASSSIEGVSFPTSDTLSLSLDISVPDDSFFQVQNAEAISGLQFVVGLLALASGVITAGSLGANFFSNVYKRQATKVKSDEEMAEVPTH